MAGIPFSGSSEAVADVHNHLANLDLGRVTAETNWLQAKGYGIKASFEAAPCSAKLPLFSHRTKGHCMFAVLFYWVEVSLGQEPGPSTKPYHTMPQYTTPCLTTPHHSTAHHTMPQTTEEARPFRPLLHLRAAPIKPLAKGQPRNFFGHKLTNWPTLKKLMLKTKNVFENSSQHSHSSSGYT